MSLTPNSTLSLNIFWEVGECAATRWRSASVRQDTELAECQKRYDVKWNLNVLTPSANSDSWRSAPNSSRKRPLLANWKALLAEWVLTCGKPGPTPTHALVESLVIHP